MDPEEERAAARERWEAVAPGWERDAERWQAGTLPLAHWMVDALAPQPGQTVLELAAGRGDVGFLAAELLRPGGRLISTDGAEEMVKVAERHAVELGLDLAAIEFKPMELEWIDSKLASVDGILCRHGYQFAVDPEAALREARRVLRPGGRIVVAVWSSPEENPWRPVVAGQADEPGQPGAFALSPPGLLPDLLRDAGFDEPHLEAIDLTFTAPSVDAWWETIRAMSPAMAPLLKDLSPADHYRLRDAVEAAWEPYADASGALAIPGRALGAVAEA